MLIQHCAQFWVFCVTLCCAAGSWAWVWFCTAVIHCRLLVKKRIRRKIFKTPPEGVFKTVIYSVVNHVLHNSTHGCYSTDVLFGCKKNCFLLLAMKGMIKAVLSLHGPVVAAGVFGSCLLERRTTSRS